MNTSRAWLIESSMLEIYFLLTRRIKGLGWTLKDFWEADTWTTSKLYLMELEVIEEERRDIEESEDDRQDSKEKRDLMVEMFGDAD